MFSEIAFVPLFPFLSFYTPNFDEVGRAYCFRVVRSSVLEWFRSSLFLIHAIYARVLKFQIRIPHGKKADPYFVVWVISLSEVMHLWKDQNEILSVICCNLLCQKKKQQQYYISLQLFHITYGLFRWQWQWFYCTNTSTMDDYSEQRNGRHTTQQILPVDSWVSELYLDFSFKSANQQSTLITPVTPLHWNEFAQINRGYEHHSCYVVSHWNASPHLFVWYDFKTFWSSANIKACRFHLSKHVGPRWPM